MTTRTSIGAPGKRVVPNPSASVMLLDPTNELLLLHRVQTSTAFPSAHVFPGGGLSEHHEQVPAVDSPARHIDGPAYRLAAIRETFEESGILLALTATGQLLNLPDDVREEGRKAIHGDKVRFTEWVKSVGGIPDVGE
jgi:8-oxo-dGTP pyrophosphatase MutT (NUDIX family)